MAQASLGLYFTLSSFWGHSTSQRTRALGRSVLACGSVRGAVHEGRLAKARALVEAHGLLERRPVGNLTLFWAMKESKDAA